jgi:putative flippase GtrA
MIRTLHWDGAHSQLVRYAIVGVLSNVALYLGYLALTFMGVEHKLAMTLLYVMGVVQTFVMNRNWSYQHEGSVAPAFVRYVVVYLAGYVVNFAGLYTFVDVLGYSHRVVQAVMIVLVAGLVFVLSRFWVFARGPERA